MAEPPLTRLEAAFFALALGAFALAATRGMTADLPHSPYSTEGEQVFFALKYGSGDFNPRLFIHPPFFSYVLFLLYGITFAAGRLTGYWASLADFERLALTDPTLFYLIARFFTLGLALAGCALLYRLALRLYGRKTIGLLACGLFCSSYLFVITAHYASTDIPQFFLSTCALLAITGVLREGRTRDYALSGVLTGLAAAVKYNAAWLAAALIAAHLLGGLRRGRPWRKILLSADLLLGCGLMPAGFLLGCPYALLDWRTFLRDYALLQKMTVSDPGIWHFDSFYAKGSGPGYLLRVVFPFLTGAPLTWLCLAGLLYALWKRKPADLLLAFFCASYCCYAGSWGVIKARYFIFVLPLFLLMGARLLAEAAEAFPLKRWRTALLGAALTLLALPSWSRIAAFDRLIAETPPAIKAKAWMEANVAPGTGVAVFSAAILSPNAASIRRQLDEIRAKKLGRAIRLERLARHAGSMPAAFDVYELPYPWRDDFDESKFDFQELRRRGVRYFMLTDEAEEYLAAPSRYKAQVKYIADVRARCRLARVFRQRAPEIELHARGEEYMEIYALDD